MLQRAVLFLSSSKCTIRIDPSQWILRILSDLFLYQIRKRNKESSPIMKKFRTMRWDFAGTPRRDLCRYAKEKKRAIARWTEPKRCPFCCPVGRCALSVLSRHLLLCILIHHSAFCFLCRSASVFNACRRTFPTKKASKVRCISCNLA